MRKITTGVQGGPILGKFTVIENQLQTLEDNGDLQLTPNGTGEILATANINLNDNSTLRLADADSSNYVELAVPATVASNITYTLPGSGVTDGYVLGTDASGNLSWVDSSLEVNGSANSSGDFYYLTTVTDGSGGEPSSMTEVNTHGTRLRFTPNTGTLEATILKTSNADLNGGNIDGTVIGAASAAAGTFTTLTATSITETSSIAYKENINPIEGALDILSRLQGVVYDRKDGSKTNEAGLIAEEVEKVLPNIITYKNGNAEGINYTKLTAYLIEAVKTLNDEIKSIKEK